MAFNVQNFADNLAAFGNIQTNKFDVRIPLPPTLRGTEGIINSELFSFRADRVDLPGVLFDSVDTKRYGVGPMIKTPSNKSRFNEISISFIETRRGEIYTTFNDWLQSIVDFAGSAGLVSRAPSFLTGYKRDYAVDMQIRVFNNSGTRGSAGPNTELQPIIELNVVDAYPISLGDTNLSWSNNNELFRTTVVFAYTYHQLVTGTSV